MIIRPEITDELDLHNFRPEEIKDLIHEYINECRKKEIFEVRIIHGKGRGVLRESVHSILGRHPDVKNFHTAPPSSGFWGATIAFLK